ncbi:MAG: tRNA pseudouridine(13) synthase TruD, partial [Nitrospinota bacterium]|nr:tRNA pseudouridine(13) synthase TruD [Nitrospinota bacterium]
AEVLRAFGIAREAAAAGLARLGARGARRPYRVRIEGAGVEKKEGADLLLRFTLPPGAYATEVLREVMKTAPPVGEEPRLAGAEEAGNSLRGKGGMA